MDIIIFRHGEKQEKPQGKGSEENRSITLSQIGIQQIEQLADQIKKDHPDFVGLDLIHSSPFPRTIQGAEIVRRKLGIKEIKSEVVLKEFYAFKDYSLPPDKRKEIQGAALDNLDLINETGYSFRQRADDILTLFKNLYQEGASKVLISGHQLLIKSIVLIIDEKYFNENLQNGILEGKYIFLRFDGKDFKVITRKN